METIKAALLIATLPTAVLVGSISLVMIGLWLGEWAARVSHVPVCW